MQQFHQYYKISVKKMVKRPYKTIHADSRIVV